MTSPQLAQEVQVVLDQLWSEGAIPFALSLGKVTKATDEYTLTFNDSRMRSANVPLLPNIAFTDMIRSAVLARVGKLSGPLHNWHK